MCARPASSQRGLPQKAQAATVISVDKASTAPLYRQVYDSVRQGILSGVWQPGEQIPSLRETAGQLHLARNTVVNAYQQLCAEGYIENRRGAGYFVTDVSFDLLRTPQAEQPPSVARAASAAYAAPEPQAWDADFLYGNLKEGSFPANTWRKLAAEALFEEGGTWFNRYGNPLGLRGLREELARYLVKSRNVRCTADQIVLTGGVQQSVERLLMLFDPAYDTFAMEDPGFPPVRTVVQDRRFHTHFVPTDRGAQAYLSALEDCHPQLIYTTPSHQMPMGQSMGLDTRLKLLELAMSNDAYVLEDDYDSVFRFDSMPLPTLKSLDTADRVIYLGTFSKTLSPAVRMGYLVLPQRLMERFRSTLERYRCCVSWLDQETLRLFMARGYWQRHVRRLEHDVRARHTLLVNTLQEAMPSCVTMLGSEAGLHLLLNVEGCGTQEQLVEAARAAGVRIGGTRRYWHSPASAPDGLVMLGYSATPQEAIAPGVEKLRTAWFK